MSEQLELAQMYRRWVRLSKAYRQSCDPLVPIALSIFKLRTEQGKVRMPQGVRRVLRRWMRRG